MREELLKKSSAYLSLLKDKKNNRLNHAYLLRCEDATMRELFLEHAAMIIMCKNHGCGACSVCNKIQHNNHVDVKKLDGANVRVKDANWLVEDAQTKSIEGGGKLYIIDRAEEMQASVQNKLLKTYEEPTGDVIMFLAVNNDSLLLPTIKSRAKKLFMERLPSQVIVEDLLDRGVNQNRAEVIAAYAQGSIERAEKMAETEEFNEYFFAAMDVLLALKSSKQIIDYIYLPIFSKEKINFTLDFLEIILSDAMLINTGARVQLKIINKNYDLEEISKQFSTAGLAVAILAINEARKRLYYNISATSVAEKVLFDILEAGYKWR